MNKWYFFFFVLLLSITACKGEEAVKPQELQLSSNGEFSNYINESDISLEMQFDKTVFGISTKQLNLLIKNNGEFLLHTGTSYQVELYVGNYWYKVPFKEDRGFTMVGIMLKPGRTYEERVSLEALNFKIVPGKYRVLKEFHSDGKHIILSAEFKIK